MFNERARAEYSAAAAEILEAGQKRFGGRPVTCSFCARDMSEEGGQAILLGEWEAARRINMLAHVFPETTAEHPVCPGCTILTLAELVATGRVAIVLSG